MVSAVLKLTEGPGKRRPRLSFQGRLFGCMAQRQLWRQQVAI